MIRDSGTSPHLNGQVDMVCQLTESDYPVTKPLCSFLEVKGKSAAVRLVKEMSWRALPRRMT